MRCGQGYSHYFEEGRDNPNRFNVVNMSDEEFKELLNVDNTRGIKDSDARRKILLDITSKFLSEYEVSYLVKLIVKCIPMGYVARLIIELRNKCLSETNN